MIVKKILAAGLLGCLLSMSSGTAFAAPYDTLTQEANTFSAQLAALQGNVTGTPKDLAKLTQLARLITQLQQNIAIAAPDGNSDELAFLTSELAGLKAQYARLTLTPIQSGSTTLYASPIGSGSACSQAAPCNLTGAQAAARVAVAANANASITVLLADGTYRLTDTLRFAPQDSGRLGYPVIWKAADGAKPVISGSTKVTGWTIADQAKGIWSAKVPAGSKSRQLYVNGKSAPIARSTPAQLGFSGNWRRTSTGYTFNGDTAASTWFGALPATHAGKLEFSFNGGNGPWTNSRCRVSQASATSITMTQPCWRNVTARAIFRDGTGPLPNLGTSTIPYWLENTYSLLNPGQWFLDENTDTLFYMPTEGQDMASLNVELPKLERLVTIAGSLNNPVHDLTLRGIQFSGATWNAPSLPTGFSDVQSNLHMTGETNQGMCQFSTPAGTCPWGALTMPLTNVTISGARNIGIIESRFVNLGGAALGIVYGAADTRIQGNEFADIASTSILLGCTYDPTPRAEYDAVIKANCTPNSSELGSDQVDRNEILQRTRIENNIIHDIGIDYRSASGIILLFAQNTIVTNNHIYNVPYTGITAGVIQGHVDNAVHPQNSTNINANNEISHNLIQNHMQKLNDGGAIYIEGHQAEYINNSSGTLDEAKTLENGLSVVGNINHSGYDTFGFYTDAGAEWIEFNENVQFNEINSRNWGHGGCQPTGNLWFSKNALSGIYRHYSCVPVPVNEHFAADNRTIPNKAGVDDISSATLSMAGLTPLFFGLEQKQPAVMDYVGPVQSGGKVLIAGSGFKPDTKVTFGGQTAAVQYISPGFLIATAPSGGTLSPVVVGSPVGRIDNTSPYIVYTGAWELRSQREELHDMQENLHISTTNGDSVKLDFVGTGIKVYGELYQDQGNIGISIDGGTQITVSTVPSSPLRVSNVAVFSKHGLAPGPHTITVTKLSGTSATFDGFEIIP